MRSRPKVRFAFLLSKLLFSTLVVLTSSSVDIRRDAQDPHFLANLSRLGPVRVDHHMKAVRPVSFFW